MPLSRPAAAALASAIGAMVLFCLASPASGADDAPAATYTCAAQGQTTPEPTEVSLELNDPPKAVAAGETLTVTGTLRITLPDAATLASRLQLATKLTVAATDFPLEVTVDGERRSLAVEGVFGEAATIASPTVLQASVTFATLNVPRNADASIVLALPRRATSAPKVTGAPERVVFGAQLAQDSPLFPTRDLDCWLEGVESKPVRLATITVVDSSTDAVDTDDGATSSPTPVAEPAAGLAPVVEAGALPVDDPGTIEAAAAAAAAAPAVATPAPLQELQTVAAIPPQTTGRGTFVPWWSLTVIGLLLPLACVLLALRQRRLLNELTATSATNALAEPNDPTRGTR